MTPPRKRAFDWFFRNRDSGKIVLLRPLNLPLGIFFVAAALRRFAGFEGTAGTAIQVIAFVSLMW